MKEKFLSWQGTKRRELFLSCCGFDSYISFVGKKLLSAFGTVQNLRIYVPNSLLYRLKSTRPSAQTSVDPESKNTVQYIVVKDKQYKAMCSNFSGSKI